MALVNSLGRSLLALLSLRAGALGCTAAVVVVVIIVVRLQDALPKFLFSAVDICIQFVAVLPDRELLVVVDRDVDAPIANGLILGIVELSYVGVFQSLVCS